jgi:hypothetical protein
LVFFPGQAPQGAVWRVESRLKADTAFEASRTSTLGTSAMKNSTRVVPLFVFFGLVGSVGFASAQTPPAAASAPMTAQQSKMGQCNQQAKGKTGDERKAFMKTCLSAKSDVKAEVKADEKPTQQNKMKACNAGASDQKLTGEPRKAFMKDCLSKK